MLGHTPTNKRCPICRSHFQTYILYRWTPYHKKYRRIIRKSNPLSSLRYIAPSRLTHFEAHFPRLQSLESPIIHKLLIARHGLPLPPPPLLCLDLDDVELMPNASSNKLRSKEKRLDRVCFNSKKRKKRRGYAGAYRYGRGKQKKNWKMRNPRKGNMRREKRFTGKMRR